MTRAGRRQIGRVVWKPVGVLLLVASMESSAATFVGIGDLPGGIVNSRVHGISADGSSVVGSSSSGLGWEAFRWRAGSGMEALGDLAGGSFESGARGVSLDGEIVVGFATDAGPSQQRAFRWSAAAGIEAIPDFWASAFTHRAHDVTADGSVVAGSNTIPFQGEVPWGAWLVRDDDTLLWNIESLDVEPYGTVVGPAVYAISASGLVWAGTVAGELVNRAVLWTEGGTVLTEVTLGPQVALEGLSADGLTAVGKVGDEGYAWTAAGGLTSIGLLPGTFQSRALDVSGDGRLVVGSTWGASGFEAIVWDAGNGMRSLEELLACRGVDLAGWQLTSARATSDDGFTIAGDGTNPGGDTEGWIATLPSLAPCSPGVLPAASGWGVTALVGLIVLSAWLVPGPQGRLQRGAGESRTR